MPSGSRLVNQCKLAVLSSVFSRYFLMLLYALQSQMKRHGCMLAVDSCMGLAMAGVFTITFASVAGLGLATWFGIQFNAATTQVLFLKGKEGSQYFSSTKHR